MSANEHDKLLEVVKTLPHKPGVYRYYDKYGNVLYIGKAKDLKNRVSSYFQEGRPKNQRLTLMISQIYKIEYTVVSTESESLILEANLIHNLQPKYNILLKDDKNYQYVRVTSDPIPSIYLVRKKYDPRSRYFGPYTNSSGIFSTLRTLRSIFPYCQEKSPSGRACNYVGLKQCEGICAGMEDPQKYLEKIEQICKVLQGKTQEVEEFLKNKIQTCVAGQNFELASLWRDRLNALQKTVGQQKTVLPVDQDIDLLTLVIEINQDGNNLGSVFIQQIRQGKIINVNNFLLSGSQDILDEAESDELAFSMLDRFLNSYQALQADKAPIYTQIFYQENS